MSLATLPNAARSLATLALGTYDDPTPTPYYAPADVADLVYLVEATVYQGASASVTFTPRVFAGHDALATLLDATPGTTINVQWSDRGWTSSPTDSVANTHYEGRLRVPLTLDRALPLTPEAPRRVAMQIGEVVIDNADGGEDLTATLAVDARAVNVKIGPMAGPYSAFTTVFPGLGQDWRRDQTEIHLTVRDQSYLFDVPVQATLYGGTGGADGGAQLAGQPVPQCYGVCRNLKPLLIDTANYVYQFHDRLAYAVDAVYDRGAALAFSADYASYAALIAASIAGGSYATCLAQGMIRIGTAPPGGLITADVRGDAAAPWGYSAIAAVVCRRILVDRGALTASQLDDAAISAVAFNSPWPGGIYFTQPFTIADALDHICAGVAMWWGTKRSGLLAVGRMSPPGTPKYVIGPVEIVDQVEELQLPDTIRPCDWRRQVNYQKNWAVQQDVDLSGSVSADRRQFLAMEYRTSATAYIARKTRNLLAVDPAPFPQSGDFWAIDAKTDAESFSDNLLTLYAPDRQILRCQIKAGTHQIDVDDTLMVVWPRFGLAAGKALRVFQITERCDQRVIELVMFG